jgi:hypothetical protein
LLHFSLTITDKKLILWIFWPLNALPRVGKTHVGDGNQMEQSIFLPESNS